MASARIKRWALKLSAFQYKIQYIPSKENACADFLSRSPLPITVDENQDQVLLLDNESVPLTARAIALETGRDPVLNKVRKLILVGWPQYNNDVELQPYFQRKTELSVEQDCVMWGTRVVIPMSVRSTLLLDLHSEHMGVVRMKAMARQYLWWPKLNSDIEEMARMCTSCREQDPMPAKSTAASWDWPTGPWRRLHLDFAGAFLNHMFLIVIDAHSKWLEVFPMKIATSETTISVLRKLFAQFGLPEHIVTDNGTQFTSVKFKNFLLNNHIRHTCSAPGHPATNGAAERYVGYFKHQMKKMDSLEISLEEKLARFLLAYRTTPHPATNETPCNMLMKRHLRTRFSALQPNLQLRKEIEVFEKNVHSPKFKVGESVYVLNLRSGPRWIPGVIVDVLNKSYSVQMSGIVTKRHEDQLRPRSVSSENCATPLNPLKGLVNENQHNVPPIDNSEKDTMSPEQSPTVTAPPLQPTPAKTTTTPARTAVKSPVKVQETAPAPRRNPTRKIVKPMRYRDS